MTTAWAKPVVLVSYYDAFGTDPFNNSEVLAHALERKINNSSSQIEVKLCRLNTIFDRAYAQTEDCIKALLEMPVMVLGLGESTCDLKVESMARNFDRTFGADNAGNQRGPSVIIPGAPQAIGLRYPLPQMYCALNSSERKNITVSNNAGSFVCNNTAFQMASFHPELIYGFIHVPTNRCSNLEQRNATALIFLEKMLQKGASYLLGNQVDPGLPHSSNDVRLMTKKEDLKRLRRDYSKKDQCLEEFLKVSL